MEIATSNQCCIKLNEFGAQHANMDEKKYLKRKEKARSDGNREQLAISCNNLGDYYNQEGQYEKAVKEYLEEADLYAKLGKKLEMAKAYRMIGEMYMLLCDFDKALEHVRVYLKTVKNLHNKVEEQRAYATLGRAHLLYGQSTSESSASTTMEQLKLAEKSFLKSLLLVKEITGQITKLEGLDMQARCYLNIGVVKEHMEEFQESIAYIERAIKICIAHDFFELTHLCYISMSLLYHCKKNDATLALRFCNLALQVAKRLPNKVQKICETLITKAEILIKAGDFASAKQILTKAYKKNTSNVNDRASIEKMLRVVVVICRTLDELVTTSSVDYCKCKKLYEQLGDGCCQLNNYSKALEYYQQMLNCAEMHGDNGKALAPIYVSLYQTYKDNQEYDKALVYLWKEYEINKDEPAEAFSTLLGIAEVCELQNQSFWTIQDVYQKAKMQLDLIKDEKRSQREKLAKICFARLKNLQKKHKMHTTLELLEQEAANYNIDFNKCDDNSDEDDDNESDGLEENTPELGADVCLDDLTDSDTSDLDETEKERPHRTTRGTRCMTIKRNNKGETQLHQACIAGNLELVRRLLDQGHTVNVRDHAGWLPLHEAANHGFREIVELLLDSGASVAINDKGGTSCDGITPLYDACVNGYLDVVELLLERGADATVKTDFGETCLTGLDRWRRSATLTTGEQAHYHQVRTTLLRPLAKVGLIGNAKAKTMTTTSTAGKNSSQIEYDDENDNRLGFQNALLSDNDENSCGLNESAETFSNTALNRQRKASENERTLKDANKSASKVYRNVMEQLKHPHRMRDDEEIPSSSGSNSGNLVSKQKRNAFLDSEEIEYDDWLIDDVGPEKKKRRFQTTSTSTTAAANSSHERLSVSKENLYDSNYSSIIGDLGMDSHTDLDAFQLLQDAANNKQRTGSNRAKGKSLSLGQRRLSKSKQQASLLDSGFCRFRSESPNSYEEDSNGGYENASTGAEPDSTTAVLTASTIPPSLQLVISPGKASSPMQLHALPAGSSASLSSSQLQLTTILFKVKVEDEFLIVPIERKKLNEINIRWLADEAARRYYNSTGLKPLLRLKTADGFAYEESDSVDIAIDQSMLIATVLEWKIAPLNQRYEEMCHQQKKEINSDVQLCLERAQASNSLELDNLWLNSQMTEPLFKALYHQNQLRVLDLSNNFIQNEGCRQLAKSICTLKQLKSLNLSGNFITTCGVEALLQKALTTTTTQSMPPQPFELELEELNLSNNPLGNDCLRILAKYCNRGQSALQNLALAKCGLTDLGDYDLCYNQLSCLDLSFNPLQLNSRRSLLGKLNSCRVQNLNLSYTHVAAAGFDPDGEDFVKFFESGTCEKMKQIELCGCNLGDAHIYRISQCLKNANNLELLDLSENKLLTAFALQYIMDEIPQLRKLIATNCQRFIDNDRLQKLAKAKHMPSFFSLTLKSDHVNVNGCGKDDVDKFDSALPLEERGDSSHAMYEELCKIWRDFWCDKAKTTAYGPHLVLYTNDKDLI